MSPPSLQQALEEAAKREEERIASSILDAQIKVVTATFNGAPLTRD